MQKSVLHECQKLYTFDQVGGEFLMQDRHGRDLAASVMLSPAFQTSWVMEKLHDKFTLFQTQTFLHLIPGGTGAGCCAAGRYRTGTTLPRRQCQKFASRSHRSCSKRPRRCSCSASLAISTGPECSRESVRPCASPMQNCLDPLEEGKACHALMSTGGEERRAVSVTVTLVAIQRPAFIFVMQ